jgi:hypothetical protein
MTAREMFRKLRAEDYRTETWGEYPSLVDIQHIVDGITIGNGQHPRTLETPSEELSKWIRRIRRDPDEIRASLKRAMDFVYHFDSLSGRRE